MTVELNQGGTYSMIVYIVLFILAGCTSPPPVYYEPPAGLNLYAQHQDYLDCHASWRQHACFLERGYRPLSREPVPQTGPGQATVVHSRP